MIDGRFAGYEMLHALCAYKQCQEIDCHQRNERQRAIDDKCQERVGIDIDDVMFGSDSEARKDSENRIERSHAAPKLPNALVETL